MTRTSCPCGLPATYADCCGRFHRGDAAAATAELLMRSRFSAFAVADTDYLLATWHPSTRPRRVDLEPGWRWIRLDILDTVDGTPFHTTGEVSFRAHYTQHGRPGVLAEHSRFRTESGRWLYLDAVDPKS
ncbi:MAG: hypothetical protein HOQ24_04395 [Mycobacteriaceae bacterium]|nr:hypothetical protein [Mycobacteriaceae bacterium]